MTTGGWTCVLESDWDVEEAALSRDGRYLAYVVNVDGLSRLQARDLASSTEVALPPLPPGVYSRLNWAPGAHRLALVVDGPRDPEAIWTVDLAAWRARQLTRSSMAGIPQESCVEPQLVRCPSFDGLEIPGWLYVPPGARAGDRRPAVFIVHGGPETQQRPTFASMDSPAIQYLVHRG